MRRVAAWLLAVPGAVALLAAPDAVAQPAPVAQPNSEGHPHKWQTVEKGMAEFLAEGFELKAVVYDTVETGAKPNALPDVHYFLQKKTQLVRCDFRKRNETSYYWCAQLTKPK